MRRTAESIWSRNYILAILVNLFIAIIFYELMTTTALYAVDRFRHRDSAPGWPAARSSSEQ